MGTLPWQIIVPLKHGDLAKSRLIAPAGVDHRALYAAMAQDSVDAALACPLVSSVLIVTSDPTLVAACDPRCLVEPDPGDGLNAAVRHGFQRGGGFDPYRARSAAMLGDLPAVRAQDLDEVLRDPPTQDWFIADHSGVGTVLLAGDLRRCRFGPDSAGRHAQAGFVPVAGPKRLCRDVDDASALAAAIQLGVGRATRRVLGLR